MSFLPSIQSNSTKKSEETDTFLDNIQRSFRSNNRDKLYMAMDIIINNFMKESRRCCSQITLLKRFIPFIFKVGATQGSQYLTLEIASLKYISSNKEHNVVEEIPVNKNKCSLINVIEQVVLTTSLG